MKYYLILALSLFLFNCNQKNNTANQTVIDVATFNNKAKDANAIIVDVRTLAENKENAIPNTQLVIDFFKDDFDSEVEKLDTTKTYLVYCKSGSRSGKAVKLMKDQGFKNVYSLEGGIENYMKK